jgi:hypothetical protein
MASPSAPGPETRLGDDDVAKLDRLRAAYRRLQDELGRVLRPAFAQHRALLA